MILKSVLIFCHIICATFAITYKITKSNNEVVQYDRPFIVSEAGNKKITVQGDFHIFDNDMLIIKHATPIFTMNKNIICHRLESGSFVDQEVTETIVIGNTAIREIKSGTFKNLKIFELILKDNQITLIEAEAITNLPNLEVLNLANNKIKKFYKNSMVLAPVRFLDMAYNQLEEITEDLFKFMNDKIPVTILLDNNSIKSVHSQTFAGILLGTLNLRNNEIEELPAEIFEKDSLIAVYLQDNRLTELPNSFFELTKLKLAYVIGNPLTCEVIKKLDKLPIDTQPLIANC